MRLLTYILISNLLSVAGLAATVPPAGQAAPGGVYQKYKPVAKPTPVVQDNAVHISLHQPSVGILFKGGVAAPMGDMSQYNEPGPTFGGDILYYASRDVALDVFGTYSIMKYKVQPGVPAATNPLTNLGIGAKLMYSFTEIEGVTPYFGAGLAMFFTNRAKLNLIKVVNNVPQYEVKQDSTGGFGLTGGFGGAYKMNDHLKAGLDIAIYSVSLGGGTSDNLLLAVPSLTILFNF